MASPSSTTCSKANDSERSSADYPSNRTRPLRSDAVRHTHEVLDRLRLLVHYSPETPRDLERRAGFSRGYLSQILGGQLPLRVEHLLALIVALGLEPAEFFGGLFTDSSFRLRRHGQPPRRRDATQALSLELAKRYGVGLESLDDLLRRLEEYEAGQRRRESSSPSSSASSAGPRSSASLCDG